MPRPVQSEKAKSTIVVKRVRRLASGAQGAAWKIAYADFLTAMMAFFLLLWLLGTVARGGEKGSVDHYQAPLEVAFWQGPAAGNSSTVLTGGGDATAAAPRRPKSVDPDAAKRARDELQQQERARMEALRARLDQAIDANGHLSEFRDQLKVQITPDGLRIRIVDDRRRPMFAFGSPRMNACLRDILRALAPILNAVDARIAIAGHTDSAQYAMGEREYSNWDLSIDRANSARRELVAAGMDGDKVARVVGLADSNPLVEDDPQNALNRRISIIVLNKLAEERLARSGGEIETGSASGASPGAEATVPDAPEPGPGHAAAARNIE